VEGILEAEAVMEGGREGRGRGEMKVNGNNQCKPLMPMK